ncbi:PREDICTED: uncharacterized protein LOC109244240 [Nicotiana attenuata]|uniref:Uncharacterized protein n=1 Tax=Nicotiana attenuata TaxID=49451 RepID=A0A314KZQ9_NICAT|nr:PREDICTED: uncharacterized protein LOC109244240 [Nicotiana attenuata]OIT34780.1 hypothetical protein A4A49_21670 [Nicotiana attenuata]
MKQNTCQKQCVLLNTYNEDEIQVANILLDLPNLFTQNQSPSQFSYSFNWGTKKRRSNRNGTDFSSRVNSSSLQGSSNEIETTKIKAEVNSPATPLSFSPSESDDKSKHSSRKISKRKTREELMDMIKQLSQCRESLKGEVENVRNYYNSQKAYNLKLKAMKEQVTRMLNIQGPGVNLGQICNKPEMELNHQQPFILDQIAFGGSETFHRFQYPLGQLQQPQPIFSSNTGLGFVNHMGPGPIGIPDLNVTVDEPTPFDLERMNVERKAQFAAARRRRINRRIEIKNASGFIRPQRRR